jgi:pyruvate dehydrogenase E1 component alpha subunit
MLTKEKLINFETDIAKIFNSGKIRSPIHLYYGNENYLIKFYKKIKKQDYIFCSWRSHYHCLLKGVTEKKVRKEILSGKSIALCFPENNIYSSAIVGGNIPIALGVAVALKRKKNNKKQVYCFVGDMTAETGIMHESLKYARNYSLPIHFIIEDNSLSVCSDTKKVWNKKKYSKIKQDKFLSYYKYNNKYPHAGAGKRVQF